MRDIVRSEANQRVDVADWRAVIDTLFSANLRQIPEVLFLGPAQTFVFSGGELSNPTASVLRITRPRGILAGREGAEAQFGQLTTEGPDFLDLDLAGLPNTIYRVFVRFEFQDGEISSRAFWDPTPPGEEFSQQTATRRLASWNARVSVSSPGPEWTEVGRVALPAFTLTDTRNLYFEGPVDNNYAANINRDPDRATNGSLNLQEALSSLRQAIEDIKGRGLRRWWDLGIGGMNVGFDADPSEGELAVGDEDFHLRLPAGAPTIQFDPNDTIVYDRPTNTFIFRINGGNEMTIDSTGITVVGDITSNGSISQGNIVIAGGSTNIPEIQFDSGDGISYERSTDSMRFRIGGSNKAILDASNLRLTGNVDDFGTRAFSLTMPGMKGRSQQPDRLVVSPIDYSAEIVTGSDEFLMDITGLGSLDTITTVEVIWRNALTATSVQWGVRSIIPNTGVTDLSGTDYTAAPETPSPTPQEYRSTVITVNQLVSSGTVWIVRSITALPIGTRIGAVIVNFNSSRISRQSTLI